MKSKTHLCLCFFERRKHCKKTQKTLFPNPGIEPGAVRAVKDMKADDVNPYTNSEGESKNIIQIYSKKTLAFRMLRCRIPRTMFEG